MNEQEPIVLQYVGNGAYIAGVPTTDLTASDIAASGFAAEEIKAYRNGTEPLYIDATPGVLPINGEEQ